MNSSDLIICPVCKFVKYSAKTNERLIQSFHDEFILRAKHWVIILKRKKYSLNCLYLQTICWHSINCFYFHNKWWYSLNCLYLQTKRWYSLNYLYLQTKCWHSINCLYLHNKLWNSLNWIYLGNLSKTF